jgi:hypothetical protein
MRRSGAARGARGCRACAREAAQQAAQQEAERAARRAAEQAEQLAAERRAEEEAAQHAARGQGRQNVLPVAERAARTAEQRAGRAAPAVHHEHARQHAPDAHVAKCVVCFEDHPSDRGQTCSTGEHFMCSGCFAEHVRAKCTVGNNDNEQYHARFASAALSPAFTGTASTAAHPATSLTWCVSTLPCQVCHTFLKTCAGVMLTYLCLAAPSWLVRSCSADPKPSKEACLMSPQRLCRKWHRRSLTFQRHTRCSARRNIAQRWQRCTGSTTRRWQSYASSCGAQRSMKMKCTAPSTAFKTPS